MKALLLGHFAATVASRILAKVKTPLETEAAWVADRGLSHALCCRAEAASDVQRHMETEDAAERPTSAPRRRKQA